MTRLRGWAAHPDRIAAVAVFLVALVVSGWNITNATPFHDDEGTYVSQALAVQQGTLAPYTYWYDHPPLGWIQLAMLAPLPQLLVPTSEMAAMRLVGAGLFALTTMMIYLLVRRVNAIVPFALLAAAIYLLSPLSLTLGRQLFLDSVGVPWVLLAIYLALSPRRALWAHVGAGAAYAIAVMTKLTLAAFGPAILAAILGQQRWRGRNFSLAGFFLTGGLLMLLYPLFALLRGELISGPGHVSLQDGLTYQFATRSGSGWLWDAGSARSELFLGWLRTDSLLIIGGVIAAALCIASVNARWIAVALLGFAVPLVLGQGYLPSMYIIAALPFLAMAIGVASDRLTSLLWTAIGKTGIGKSRLRVGRRAIMTRPATLTAAWAICLVLLVIPVAQWTSRGAPLLTNDANTQWRASLSWVDSNVARTDVVAVPYSLLPDLQERGWDRRWTAIALEKVDLDPEFRSANPQGWRDIDWIVDSPTVAPKIRDLGLITMGTAYQNSDVVANFGDWRIRKVRNTPDAEREAGKIKNGKIKNGQAG